MASKIPGVTPLRELTLAAVNTMLTRLRERIEALEARLPQSPATAASVTALEMQIKALQSGGKTVVSRASASAIALNEVLVDPGSPQPGDAWVLRTLQNPPGTLQGFAGGFPLVLAVGQNRFDLSIATSEGTKRVQIA